MWKLLRHRLCWWWSDDRIIWQISDSLQNPLLTYTYDDQGAVEVQDPWIDRRKINHKKTAYYDRLVAYDVSTGWVVHLILDINSNRWSSRVQTISDSIADHLPTLWWKWYQTLVYTPQQSIWSDIHTIQMFRNHISDKLISSSYHSIVSQVLPWLVWADPSTIVIISDFLQYDWSVLHTLAHHHRVYPIIIPISPISIYYRWRELNIK